MFAPATQAQPKSTESSGSKRAAAPPTLMSRLSGGGAKEYAHALQRSIGNQATLRLIGQRVAGNELGGDTEQDAERSILRAGVSRDFSTVAVLAREPQNEAPPVATTAQAEREREVEAINVGGTDYVLYQTKVRGGGSSSWLANNPGNLDYTADTVAWGCYEGKSLKWGKHRFAIFQNEDAGLAAVRGFLRKYQTTRDITLMMNLFAPAGDLENNPTQYSEKVAKRIGGNVTVHTLVKDLSDDQIAIFAEAIKDAEGWTPGPVNDVPRGDPSLPEGVRDR